MSRRLPFLALTIVLALVAGLPTSPAAAADTTDEGAEAILEAMWLELTTEQQAIAHSLAGLRPTGEAPEPTAVAPGASPVADGDPTIIAMNRSVLEGVPFVADNWEGAVGGVEQAFPPATTEFYDASSSLVLNHFVFDRPVDDCGTGQIEVAAFEEIAGTPVFPGLDGFVTPDTESTRATAFLCRGGESQTLHVSGAQAGQPFASPHDMILFSGPVVGFDGPRQQLLVITENPTSVLRPTITVADDPADPATYRWRQWTAREPVTNELAEFPARSPEDLETMLEALGLAAGPSPVEGELAGVGVDDASASAGEAVEADTGDEEATAAGDGEAGDDGTTDADDQPSAQEIDNTTAILDEPDGGSGTGGLLLALLVLALAAALIGAFVFRNVLFGWARSAGPQPSYDDRPVFTSSNRMRANFFTELVNDALDAGRQPGPDGMVEFEAAEIHAADLNGLPLGNIHPDEYGNLQLEPNQRLVINPRSLQAFIRTYETSPFAAGRP